MNALEEFDDLIPGTRRSRAEFHEGRRSEPELVAPSPARRWDARPREMSLNGVNTEFFTIGSVATALGRSPITIRSWIDKGWLPPARYRTPGIPGTRGNAGLRLWTRAQIEVIIAAAASSGLLGAHGLSNSQKHETMQAFAEKVREEMGKL